MITKLFFDMEFTGLHQNTTAISIGIVSDKGSTFYAELTDYDKSQVTPWVQENVIDKPTLKKLFAEKYPDGKGEVKETRYPEGDDTAWVMDNAEVHFQYEGTTSGLVVMFEGWLAEITKGEPVEMWSDVLAYDWMLFNKLFAKYDNDGYPHLPDNICYIPFDIATLMKAKGVDPDTSREEFAGLEGDKKHNALWDAEVIKECYNKVILL